MTTTILGKVSVTNGGDYSPDRTYEKLTIVTYQGSSYITLKSVTAVTPSADGINYQLISLKGKDAHTPIKGVDYLTLEEIEEIEAGAASKVKVPSKTSELENDSGYLTNHQSLDNYYTKTLTDNLLAGKQPKGNYALKEEMSTKADLSYVNNELSKKQPVGDYALNDALNAKANKTELPTKVSDLQNDIGYLIEHQSLVDYYDKTAINALLDDKQKKGDYVLRGDLSTKADKAYVDEELQKKQPVGDYALKSEVPTKLSELQDDSHFSKETAMVILTTNKIVLEDNIIYRGDKLASINLELPTLQKENLFDCELDLTIGASPMQVTAPSGIKWLGDDIQNNAWVPKMDKRYVLFIHWDGQYFRAVSQSEEAI